MYNITHTQLRLRSRHSTDRHMARYELHNTPCLKKRPAFTTCYNVYIHSLIATIFGTNIAEKVGNQNALYLPTSPN